MAPKKKASRRLDLASSAKRPIKGPSQALRSPVPQQSLRRLQSMVTGLASDPVALARVEAEMDGLIQRCSTPTTSPASPAPPVGAPPSVSSSSEDEGEDLSAGGLSHTTQLAQSPVLPASQAAAPRVRGGPRGTTRRRTSARIRAAWGSAVQSSSAVRSVPGHSPVVSFQSVSGEVLQGDGSESSVEDSLPPPPKSSSGGLRRRKKSSKRRTKRRRRDTSSSSAGLPTIRVWIVGHSIVHWAACRARQSELGAGLGFPQHLQVSWISRRGMLWKEFLPLMQRRVLLEGPPTAIVVQLGENDMVSSSCYVLRAIILQDLRDLAALVPATKIIWSHCFSVASGGVVPALRPPKGCGSVLIRLRASWCLIWVGL
uniref:uncharacterized protein LOC114600328 n=1 Tax=Podarcis muralis TaxID=64176 RepID=UPI00109F65D2|nr:uncharacterized protein LOC114600328 [Podarcis muralis]